MGKYHGCRVEFQTAPGNLPRVDGCAVDGPEKQVLSGDQAVPVVQEDAGEDLGRLPAVVDDEIIRDRLRTGEHGSTGTARR